ncbi:MAG: LamG domain-containing protein [bacterium]|nr:LamG domain-containing protein [bacterium]
MFSTDSAEGSYSVEFNGVDDYLYTNSGQSFNSDFTWTAYIKTSSDGTIIAKAPLTGDWAQGGKSLFVRSGTLQFDVGWVGALNSSAVVNDGGWHHVAVTAQINSGSTTDTVKIYVDGQLKATKASWSIDTYSDDALVVKIGCTNDDFPSVPYFDGLIDDVRIYDRVLDAAEIAAL